VDSADWVLHHTKVLAVGTMGQWSRLLWNIPFQRLSPRQVVIS